MRKISKMLSMMLAVIFITVAFAPAAFAVTYAPLSWSSWPQQKRYAYDTRYTYAIQRFLRDRYIMDEDDMPIDGIFGIKTYDKVVEFQRNNGLDVDGIVGANTWDKMFRCLAKTEVNSRYERFEVRTYNGAQSNGTAFDKNLIGSTWSVVTDTAWFLIYR